MINARVYALSYLSLRKDIGLLGLALPFLLALGRMWLEGPGLLGSLSSYYYSSMRDVLVGSLCIMGAFLLSYHGYEPLDDQISTVAGFSVIGIALFPIDPDVGATALQRMIALIHLGFGVCFFTTLALFALYLFPKTDQLKPTAQKKQRNMIYYFCGTVIVVCTVLLILVHLVRYLGFSLPWIDHNHLIFWLECPVILAFGASWFIKGETLLKDV